ncbi:MAG: glycosyltransferase family 4 protein, partial [Chloroflexaceae bacterium]|nr:glycosyltransferase family 4 protein [Chloroflexaceae bacterium]
AATGLLDTAVIFLDTWIPYHKRGAYLAEADAGVSAHLPGVETRLAFRTRLLDYIWARLPVLCSAGDSLGAALAEQGAGRTVAPGDGAAWRDALRQCANPEWRAACRSQMQTIAEQWTWPAVARPLAAFCAAPRRTAMPMLPALPDTQQAELDRLRALVRAYEQGRFMRLMRWLHRIRGTGR